MSLGPLLALLSRLTVGRANNLDRLDATISSRAAAAHYTEARAQKLDYLTRSLNDLSSQASIDQVQGPGFDEGQHSLAILRSVLNNMEGSGFNTTDDSLKIISDKIDQMAADMVTHTISTGDPTGGDDGDIWFKV
jgi:hypothetical protein